MLGVLTGGPSDADARTFGLVAKSVDDGNFVDTWRGCDREAKKSGDECVLLGGGGGGDARLQAQAVENALKGNRFDALAISVTASEIIAKAVQSARVPIVTFDSPFSPADEHLSRAYIGTDNVAMGRALAKIAKQLRPRGGSLCLMTSAHDPNLAQRIQGVRQELSEDDRYPQDQRLSGEHGWTEQRRCPWNSADKLERTMDEIDISLKRLKPNVFISVGHWPVVDAAAFRRTVEPYRDDLVSQRRLMIVATGALGSGQRSLMNDRLIHGYVSINFDEVGRLTYLRMREAVDGKQVPAVTYSPGITQVGK